jgi:DNA-binding transcriptional regulator YiaG
MNVTPEYWTPARLHELRAGFGYSQSEFARVLGVSLETLKRYESEAGRHLPPNATVCRLLAFIEAAPRPIVLRLKAACAVG